MGHGPIGVVDCAEKALRPELPIVANACTVLLIRYYYSVRYYSAEVKI